MARTFTDAERRILAIVQQDLPDTLTPFADIAKAAGPGVTEDMVIDLLSRLKEEGVIQPDNTVKGGTGWGAEFAKICNKPLIVFDQARNGWFAWDREADEGRWEAVESPVIDQPHFAATGTRFLEDNGRDAIQDLFKRSFKR